MATATLKMFPYVQLDAKGQVQFYGMYTWAATQGYDKDSGTIKLCLPPIDVVFEVPEDYRPQALALLRENRTKLTAEHQALLTKMQYTENQLLAIEHSDILDADEGPRADLPMLNEDGDDIPF